MEKNTIGSTLLASSVWRFDIQKHSPFVDFEKLLYRPYSPITPPTIRHARVKPSHLGCFPNSSHLKWGKNLLILLDENLNWKNMKSISKTKSKGLRLLKKQSKNLRLLNGARNTLEKNALLALYHYSYIHTYFNHAIVTWGLNLYPQDKP